MPPPREIELKLDVPVHNLPRLTDSSLLKGASKSAAKSVNLVSVYFDTNSCSSVRRAYRCGCGGSAAITCRLSSRKMETRLCLLAANGNTTSPRNDPISTQRVTRRSRLC